MITVAASLTIILLVFTGLVLHRRLATFLYSKNPSSIPAEVDLLLLGILPGIALVGAAMTYLAVLHLFRFEIVLFLAAAAIWVCRQDAFRTVHVIGAVAADIVAATKRGNLFPAIAFIAFAALTGSLLVLSQMPTGNGDVWYYHIPLAQSIVDRAGLVYPQISSLPFYSSQPAFFELLHATAFLAVNHFVAANLVNIAILYGLLFLLLSFASRARAFQFLVIYVFVAWLTSFAASAAEPVTDLPRSCFSVAAYLFAFRYAMRFQCYDICMSAILAGAAAAGKYTELDTPVLICLCLVPMMISRRETWNHMIAAIIAFTCIASFWYLKNWIVYTNPVYPFLFAHPGLSDQWMVDYMMDLHRPASVAARAYVTNLFSLRGWHDFAIVLYEWFLGYSRTAYVVDALFLLSLALPRPRAWMLPLLAFLLFTIWYGLMFNSARWSISAITLLYCTAFITWAWIVDRTLDFLPSGRVGGLGFQPEEHAQSVRMTSLLKAGAIVIFLWAAASAAGLGDQGPLPQWLDKSLLRAAFTKGGLDEYQTETKTGYAMYRYIADHDLHNVLQPFDNGAILYASAYNGGRPNRWILPYLTLPANAAETPAFERQQGIHYFIDIGDIRPEYDSYGKHHVDLAVAVMDRLRLGATLVYKDNHGWSLYKTSDKVLAQ